MVRVLNRIEQTIFYFLLFAIPFQTRIILWQQNWYFNEWQSIAIYGTDILLIILFIFWAFSFNLPNFKKSDLFLLCFILISAISVRSSLSPIISIYQLIKLVEFVVFYFYIKSYAFFKFNFLKSILILIMGGTFQAVIAILQFLKQHDLALKYLGESPLSPDLNGVASFFSMTGQKIIRSYGTTPHPNILATYLLISIFALYFFWLYSDSKKSKILVVTSSIILLGLFYTFSRVMILLWVLGFLARVVLIGTVPHFKSTFWENKNLRKKLIEILLVTLIITITFSTFYWLDIKSRILISANEEAVQLRIFYGQEAIKSIHWFGIGVGNFVNWFMAQKPNLSRNLYQPVHNIYLLIYSETGFLGILFFVLFLVFLIRDFVARTRLVALRHYSFLILFLSFLFIGLFDHFLWTLQQGRLMFWLILAFMATTE